VSSPSDTLALPSSSGAHRAWALVPWLLPLFYLALVLGLQPPERLGEPEAVPWLGRLVYDDYDPAARALRGLNATLGRTAGRPAEPAAVSEEEFAEQLDRSHEADKDTPYFLEYPHAALVLFRVGYLTPGRLRALSVPTAVADARFTNLLEHRPRNAQERELWRTLRQAIRVYAVLSTCCLLALMAMVRAGYEPGGGLSGSPFLLVLPAMLYFTVNRFDVVPALLTALSLWSLGHGRLAWSAGLLALGTMVKVYPVLLVPLVMGYLAHNRRNVARWLAVYATSAAALIVPPLLFFGWQATLAPYRFQLTRPLEGWTLYGYVLPPQLAGDSSGTVFRAGAVLFLLYRLVQLRPYDLAGLLRRAALVLVIFSALSVFYSPQWILWLAPLLVPLGRSERAVARFWIGLDFVTYLSFPVVYDVADGQIAAFLQGLLIYARCAVLGGLCWVLWKKVRSEPRPPG
jgi:hypothetical protein